MTDALNTNRIPREGEAMDKDAKIARYRVDREAILDQLAQLRSLREKVVSLEADKELLREMRRLEIEFDHVCDNISNLLTGKPEKEWVEPLELELMKPVDTFEDLGPEDGVPLH